MEKILNYSQGIILTNDVDVKTRKVKFYWASFDGKDRNGRVMLKNAFNRTIANNVDKVYHLKNHNENTILGKVIELGKDEKGAFAVSQLSNSTDGKNAIIHYDEGIYKYHSFGFYILNSHDEGGVEMVDEAKVIEVSTVLHPAHDKATTISMNTYDPKVMDALLKSNNDIKTLLNSMNTHLLAQSHQVPSAVGDINEVIEFMNNKY